MPHTAAGIGHITGVARDDVYMHMRHRLPGSGTRIEADVVAIGLRIEPRIQQRFDAGDKLHQGGLLGRRALKEGGHHAPRDHQHMPRRDRKRIEDRKAEPVGTEPLGFSDLKKWGCAFGHGGSLPPSVPNVVPTDGP